MDGTAAFLHQGGTWRNRQASLLDRLTSGGAQDKQA
jgi:hypothetical protein